MAVGGHGMRNLLLAVVLVLAGIIAGLILAENQAPGPALSAAQGVEEPPVAEAVALPAVVQNLEPKPEPASAIRASSDPALALVALRGKLLAEVDADIDGGRYALASRNLARMVVAVTRLDVGAAVPVSQLEPIQLRIRRLNQAWLLAPDGDWAAASEKVRDGDALERIVRRFRKDHGLRVTVEMLRLFNGLRGDLIYPGQTLRVPTGEIRIEIWKASFTMVLWIGEAVAGLYPVGLGNDLGPTPEGDFSIINRSEYPVWFRRGAPPGQAQVPPYDPVLNPDNPLGTRWIGFAPADGREGLGIHGTNDDAAIGHKISQGCIRMLNRDVEEAYPLVPRGSTCTIY